MVQYTPQREWVHRRGILLWLAFFFIELGAGTYFVSSIFGSSFSMLIGWLVCSILGGGFHLFYLGRPARLWRMVVSKGWQTSWISRGLIFVGLFLVLGLAYLGLDLWSTTSSFLLIITNIFALLTIIYGGFAMNYINGIPMWNSALLPILYLVSGLWGGAEVTLGISLVRADVGLGPEIEKWIRVLLLGCFVIIPVYLISVRYSSVTGQASVSHMVSGQLSLVVWTGVVAFGRLVPITA
jgi:formate-dependent nitrite reductase membrane component NrfD